MSKTDQKEAWASVIDNVMRRSINRMKSQDWRNQWPRPHAEPEYIPPPRKPETKENES